MHMKSHLREPFIKSLKVDIFWLSVLVLMFALYLVRVPVSVPVTILCFVTFGLLASGYILQANNALLKHIRNHIETAPLHFFVIPATLWLLSIVYAALTGQLSLYILVAGFLYCAIPALFIFSLKKSAPSPQWLDVIVILLLWLPIEFGWITHVSIPPIHRIVDAYHLIGLILLIYFYFAIRGLPRIGYTFELSDRDWRMAIQNFIFFMPFALLIGLPTDFIAMSKSLPALSEMLASLIGIMFFIALPEEILFRGIIHNFINMKFEKKKNGGQIALVISSVIFGFAHANNNNPPFIDVNLHSLGVIHLPYIYIILASIAGYFYGLAYMKTGKVTTAALVHLFVDWTWTTFLNG